MLLNFKKVGDLLSLDDYNAVIYLLMHNDYLTEQIILSPEGYNGLFANYTLTYDEEISLQGDYYLVVNEGAYLTLSIDSEFQGDFNIILKVYDDVIFEEEVDSTNSDSTTEKEITLQASNLDGRQEINIPLSTIGADKYFSAEAEIKITYNSPIVDKTSGSIYNDLEQHIISSAEDLYSAVENAPENETTTLNLLPGLTYECFDLEDDQSKLNQNILVDNKTIEIESGSIPSVLDAGGLHRHFYVTETGSLKLTNIELSNGYSLNDTLDNGKGGSVFVKSARDDNNNKRQGKLIVSASKFTNNRANLNGGAVYNEDGIIDIKNTFFYNNTAKSSNNVMGDGGAIYNEGAS